MSEQNKKITVYKVTCDGSWCAFDNLGDAVEMLSDEVDNDLFQPKPGDESNSYKIVVDEMTEEEFKNLPEFNGF